MHWYITLSLITTAILLVCWGAVVTHAYMNDDWDEDEIRVVFGISLLCIILGFLFPAVWSLGLGALIYISQKKTGWIQKLIEGE